LDWIAFRHAQVAYKDNLFVGATIQTNVRYNTLQELTEERIKQLQEAIDEQEH
jgi:uncharacterized protein YecT (DUF1311 family)